MSVSRNRFNRKYQDGLVEYLNVVWILKYRKTINNVTTVNIGIVNREICINNSNNNQTIEIKPNRI